MGQGQEGLLCLELKILGLLQNTETQPKEDGREPSQTDINSRVQIANAEWSPLHPGTRTGYGHCKRPHRGDGI